MPTLIVTEAELRSCFPMSHDALTAVEDAFTAIEHGQAKMPPVLHIGVDAQSEVDTKGAYLEGRDHLAVKIATGFYGNASIGLPSCSSIVALINIQTGLFDCVFLDNGYLMDLRTGLAGAVAAKHLSPQTVEVAGVIGTGALARYQMESLAMVRPFETLLVYGRDQARIASYCADMEARLGVPVQPADSVEALVTSAQVVVTTTPSTDAIIDARWVHSDLHITAMGSDAPGKQELDADILRRADLLVCDKISQCQIGGELQHLSADAHAPNVQELGAFTSGAVERDFDASLLTVCDLTGTGAQDTAIACAAFDRVRAAKLGTVMG